MANPFALADYLARVGLETAPAPNVEGLFALHQAQFYTIPFENFDIQLGRSVNLAPDHLVQKLVGQKRGGYCFELNGLMLMALQALGYQARPLLARVHLEPTPSGRTHQVNLVEIDGRPWLMDVGFGAGGLRVPVPLETGRIAEGPGWAFRFVEQEPWGTMMQSREGEDWQDSYSFDLSHVTGADIAVGNHYTSTSPASHFLTSRVASRPLPDGRISLRDFLVTEIIDGHKTTREIEPGPAYLAELVGSFSIDLEVDYSELKEVGS